MIPIAAGASLLILAALFGLSRSLLPNAITPLVLLANAGFQVLALLLVDLLGGSTVVAGMLNPVDIADAAAKVCASHLLIGAGITAGVLVFALLGTGDGFRSILRRPSENLDRTLVFLTVMLVSRWFVTAGPVSIAYAVKAISAPLGFVPFFAGLYSSSLCIPLLAFGAAAGGLLGSREGLVYLGLYGIGAAIARRRHRTLAIVLTATAGLAVFNAAGVVAKVRGSAGRDSLDLLRSENVTRWLDLALDHANSGSLSDPAAISAGVGRLFSWPNAVVTMLTPETVPYAGLASLIREIPLYGRIWGPSPEAIVDSLDAGLGTAPASQYGFAVDRYTAAEFGLVADGWYRGGPAGVFIFATLATLLFLGAETWSARSAMLDNTGKIVLACVLCRMAMIVHVYPLLHIARGVILYGCVFAALVCAPKLVRRTPWSAAGPPAGLFER